MMDATRLYTHSGLSLTNSFSTSITMDSTEALSRSCAGVTYYYIDFGTSSYFHPSRSTSPSRPRLVLGTGGRDDEAPELSATVPYDPFKVDIFTLGNLFRRQFYDVRLVLFAALLQLSFPLLETDHPTAGIHQCRVPRSSHHSDDASRPYQKTHCGTSMADMGGRTSGCE